MQLACWCVAAPSSLPTKTGCFQSQLLTVCVTVISDGEQSRAGTTVEAPVVADTAEYVRQHRSEWIEWLELTQNQQIGAQGGALFDPNLYSAELRSQFVAARAPTELCSTECTAKPIEQLVILCVHAHNKFQGPASIAAVRAAFGNPPTLLVSLPCCHQFNPINDIGRPPDETYEDQAIFSDCRTVNLWRWAAGPIREL